jgi:ribokinase
LAVRLVVLGSLNVDHTAWVGRLPGAGETVAAIEGAVTLGGKGFNQAVTAARQGAPVAMVGCVGDDEEGDWLVQTLVAEGVDVGLVRRSANHATGRAQVTVDASGANTVVVVPGANGDATFPTAALEGCSVLLAQLEVPLPDVIAALATARAAGVVTVLNPSPARLLEERVLALVDYLVVNEVEASITGARAAATNGSSFQGTLVITEGERGAVVTKGGRARRLDAIAVDAVVDPTGAGDAFCGTLAAGLALGWAFGVTLTRAAAAGAHAVSVAGTLPSLPTAAQIDALLVP